MKDNAKLMNALDALSGSEASCTVKMSDGRRYNLMQVFKFEAKMDINATNVAILGRSNQGSKPTGWKGTWSGAAYYNTSIFRMMMLEYKKTGKMPEMVITVSNEDPTSAAGRQTVVLLGVLINSLVLAKYDASTDSPIEEDISGTFDDWDMPETFSMLPGMAD